ncbi:MAG: hypothetical protein MK108_10285 [Mariniblastus sp.]|nr:hypothetical protein [Mariniblastus sp.]
MYPNFKQLIGWLTTVSIVSSGMLFAVHVHGSDGCVICHGPHLETGCGQNSADLPFLPPHEAEDCVVCHFSGDSSDLLPVTVMVPTAQVAEAVSPRPIVLNLFPGVLAYQGRAPPQTFSL